MGKQGLGDFEQLVLLAVMRLGPNAYGVTVRREIHERTGRDVALGAIYPTLDRLETKGFVCSEIGEPTSERGGRAKRFYELQPEGMEALRRARAEVDALWSGFEYQGDESA